MYLLLWQWYSYGTGSGVPGRGIAMALGSGVPSALIEENPLLL